VAALSGVFSLAAGAAAGRPARLDPPATIELAAGTSGSALFAVGGLVPGHPVTNCLAVGFHDTVPGSVIRLYAVARPAGLSPYLAVTVRTGRTAGGTGTGCAGFVPTATPFRGRLSDLAAAERGAPAGLPMLRLPDPDGSVTFEVTVSVVDADAAQGRSTRFDLVWSAPAAEAIGAARTAAPGQPAQPGRSESALLRLAHAVGRLVHAFGLPALKAGFVGIPVGGLVVLFLLVQNYFDRRDPKLALAPIRPPAQLDFVDREAMP
jgi:hypothetical protein